MKVSNVIKKVFNVIKKAIKWYLNLSAIYMTPSGMIPIRL